MVLQCIKLLAWSSIVGFVPTFEQGKNSRTTRVTSTHNASKGLADAPLAAATLSTKYEITNDHQCRLADRTRPGSCTAWVACMNNDQSQNRVK